MHRSFHFCVLIMSLAVFSSAQKTAVEPFEVNEAGVKVKFPGKPDRSAAVVDTWYGKGTVITFMFQSTDRIFRLSIADAGSPLLGDDDFKTRLDVVEKGETAQWGVPVAKQKRGEFLGLRGREAVLEGSTVSLITRALFVDTKFVYFTVFIKGKLSSMTAADADAARKSVDEFLDSFAYSKPK